MGLSHSPNIVTSGLNFCLDAANVKSYPGTGTTWTDLTGKGISGTLTNGPTYSSANSGIIQFNGTNNLVTVPDNSIFSFTNQIFTFNYWIKFDDILSSHGIIGKGQGSWEYGVYASGAIITFYTWPLGGQGPVYSPLYVPIEEANKWYNHCWTADGKFHYVYVDGVLVDFASKIITYNMADGSSALTIGAGGDSGGLKYLKGAISNMCIYNKSLSLAEIRQNYNSHRGRFGL